VTEPGKELAADNTADSKEKSAAEIALEAAQVYDIGIVGPGFEEFLLRDQRRQEDTQWIEEFKAQLDRISGGAEYFTLHGREVLTYKRNGNLNSKKLGEQHPDLIAKYTRLVTELKLDKEALERDEPEIYNAFKAKVFRVSPRAKNNR